MNSSTLKTSPAVSILVPVYNTQHYLSACLTSLCTQSLRDIEILVLDDGSTDDSPRIMEQFAARDERIRVIHKSNSGYGDTMNQGLAAAQGTYIGICEPDDFCSRAMFKKLYRSAVKHDADIVKSNYLNHEGGRDSRNRILDPFPYKRVFNPADMPHILLTPPTIWTALYRRSMIEAFDISFTTSPGASFQDASFGHQCWAATTRAVLLPGAWYHYRLDNEASSSKSGDKVFAIFDEYERSFAFLQRTNKLEDFGPMLGAMQFAVSIWNYNRIAPEHHESFARRWAETTTQTRADGLLDTSVLPAEYLALAKELTADPAALCAHYPDEIPYHDFVYPATMGARKV